MLNMSLLLIFQIFAKLFDLLYQMSGLLIEKLLPFLLQIMKSYLILINGLLFNFSKLPLKLSLSLFLKFGHKLLF